MMNSSSRTHVQILNQEYEASRFEVLVVHGESNDTTRDLVARLCQGQTRERLVELLAIDVRNSQYLFYYASLLQKLGETSEAEPLARTARIASNKQSIDDCLSTTMHSLTNQVSHLTARVRFVDSQGQNSALCPLTPPFGPTRAGSSRNSELRALAALHGFPDTSVERARCGRRLRWIGKSPSR